MSAIKFFDEVLKLFSVYRNDSKILDYFILHKIIRSNFERRYILNEVNFEYAITDITYSNANTVFFYLTAADKSLYRAEVNYDGEWYLRSFLFSCQSCFGFDNQCNVCGGSGWGVL